GGARGPRHGHADRAGAGRGPAGLLRRRGRVRPAVPRRAPRPAGRGARAVGAGGVGRRAPGRGRAVRGQPRVGPRRRDRDGGRRGRPPRADTRAERTLERPVRRKPHGRGGPPLGARDLPLGPGRRPARRPPPRPPGRIGGTGGAAAVPASGTEGSGVGLRGPLNRRDFRRLMIGQITSSLGDWMGTLALMYFVLELSGSTTAVGGVLVLRLLPYAVGAPVAARIVTRWRRRSVMMKSDLIRVGMAVLLPVLPWLWWVYFWAFAIEVVGLVFLPARDAAIPYLISGPGRGRKRRDG